MAPVHPLSELSFAETQQAIAIIRKLHGHTDLVFKAVTLEEPIKEQTIAYLNAEQNAKPLPSIPRTAFAAYYFKGTDSFITTYVNLSSGLVERTERMSPEYHGNVDFKEVVVVEEMVMKDPAVVEHIQKLQLPSHLMVVPEAWGFGTDGLDDARRQYQVYMFVGEKSNPDSNHYARPLSFSPVVDPVEMKVTRIDQIPTGEDWKTGETGPWQYIPPKEYVPEETTLRKGLKPLQIVQPAGPSYSITPDNVITWQKWHARIGFNYREGVVLRDVRYDGRPIFYRISLSEMTVPYADPRSPYHRKQAFDLGDVGAGLVSNNLKLGCDCLGSITYLDGLLVSPEGEPVVKENAVCIHEQDNGIGWKHSNYRTDRACVVRNRELVIQQILTVSNYEYILAFIFNQAGELHYEVRATGILSTAAIDPGCSVPWGTIVHEGVLAQHHQHLLSLRIDPAIGSYTDGNRLAYSECYAMPMDDFNPHGNGYISKMSLVEKAGGIDLDSSKSRVFMIQNAQITNTVNKMPIAYKIVAPPMQKILAHPDSYHFKRAEFADHNIYVTKYRQDELFSGGKYTNQSRGGEGIKSWVARGDSVVDEDIVVWVQFGLNHVPRIEDFPVMPVEILKVSLKPVNFFDRNPSVDVPPSQQNVNQSTFVHRDATGGACCAEGPKREQRL
ncbi:hypothetical protein Z517_12547 [Fonsecaea pedrosoi CBS 271.37]|uniref:Amine oxidase n=1 Tax=Fonsecaea pedrosoi CBS 271.37 TaxID=1442368 RepID=A0A0D2EIF3_9EURO|nr:uncharacterized protein Z517_12547 [Fonsecaea pedrosoi CBS 271.37]KIW74137.1 hypothetical protein Z517_12547 [Fonsecaea pedrosoi CBS 271.37]